MTRLNDTAAGWLETAKGIAREIRATSIERERTNRLPVAELQRLRDTGLVNLRIPKAAGGIGASLGEAAQVVVELSKADPTIGFLTAFHYNTTNIPRLLDYRDDGADILRRSAKERWLWGNIWQLRDPNLIAQPRAGGGFVLNGTKRWSSGAGLGDVILVAARHAERPEFVGAVISSKRRGLRYHGDWDAIGLRHSESETVTFKNVIVKPDEVLAQTIPGRRFTGVPAFYGNLANPLSAAFYLGTALGALEAAREFVLTQAKPRTAALSAARNDPLLHAVHGEGLLRVQAGLALLAQVSDEAEVLWARRTDVTQSEIDALTSRVASLLAYSAQVALEVTAKAFEASGGGASATLAKHGLDRYWRDVRTFSLHNPLAVAAINVGNYFLNGTMPKPPVFFTTE